MPLQELKTKVAGLSSIPKILYAQDQAGNLLDDAMATIEKATSKPIPVVQEPGSNTTATTVNTGSAPAAPKPSKVIRAADLLPSIYLETEADVEGYIEKLRTELLETIHSGKRARIS